MNGRIIEPQHGTANHFSVRVLTRADAEVYRAVRIAALNEEPPAFGSLPEDEPPVSATAEKLAATDDRCFFGAFRAGQLIGIVRLTCSFPPIVTVKALSYSLPQISHRDDRGRRLSVLRSFFEQTERLPRTRGVAELVRVPPQVPRRP
jgi:hypothetical protein